MEESPETKDSNKRGNDPVPIPELNKEICATVQLEEELLTIELAPVDPRKPIPGDTVYLYLSSTSQASSSMLVQEEDGDQTPIYYVSKVLNGAEGRLEALRQLVKWVIELSEYDISYLPRTAIKAQALADFMSEMTGTTQEEVPEESLANTCGWILHRTREWNRTTPRGSTGESSFFLAYGTEALIPAELGIPSHRIMHFNEESNSQLLKEHIDLINEIREAAFIRTQRYKKHDDKRPQQESENPSFSSGRPSITKGRHRETSREARSQMGRSLQNLQDNRKWSLYARRCRRPYTEQALECTQLKEIFLLVLRPRPNHVSGTRQLVKPTRRS
ncbi:UNVERIFIED_CONTAM: hypothetical protein Scaly_1644900 [Sesamum calycinum]|uniref:Uncharacterized protein n=1 Tax=Sesamum calycinum TaxID=2727403 RepID=A0AAW2P8H1_9LAMI